MKKLIAACFLLLLSSCDSVSTTIDVIFRVTGTAETVTLAYYMGGDNDFPTLLSNVTLPWSYGFKAAPGDVCGLTVTWQGEGQSVTATITKDGHIFKSATDTSHGEGVFLIKVSGTI